MMGLVLSPGYAGPAIDVKSLSIKKIQLQLSNKSVRCTDIIDAYLNRIKRYDLSLSRGAPMNALVAINPSAHEEAKTLDRYANKHHALKGPMHCVPVVIKDNIDSIDTPSTSGSLALLGSRPTQDASLVKQLKKAGAIIIAKGAMDEFASGMFGYSSKSGRVGNAYDPNLNPGGSSGGVAVAVAASFAVVGIGSDNSGSIRIPASFNRLYGLRPSTGLVSQTGIFPRGNLDGVAGPITRTLADMAVTLNVIAAVDQHDSKTLAIKPRVNTKYLTTIRQASLKGKRIGLVKRVGTYQPFKLPQAETKQLMTQALNVFDQAGAKLIDVQLPEFNVSRDDNMGGEVEEMNDYLKRFPSTRRDFSDICHSKRTLIFGTEKECMTHPKKVALKSSTTYQAVLTRFKKNRQQVMQLMKEKKLDALLLPISRTIGPTYEVKYITSAAAPISSNAGLPSLGFSYGKRKVHPTEFVALELVGGFNDESRLLALGAALEKEMTQTPAPKLSHGKEFGSLMDYSISQCNLLFTELGALTYNRYFKPKNTMTIPAKTFAKFTHLGLINFKKQQGIHH